MAALWWSCVKRMSGFGPSKQASSQCWDEELKLGEFKGEFNDKWEYQPWMPKTSFLEEPQPFSFTSTAFIGVFMKFKKKLIN